VAQTEQTLSKILQSDGDPVVLRMGA
jgi:hypothetical protein